MITVTTSEEILKDALTQIRSKIEQLRAEIVKLEDCAEHLSGVINGSTAPAKPVEPLASGTRHYRKRYPRVEQPAIVTKPEANGGPKRRGGRRRPGISEAIKEVVDGLDGSFTPGDVRDAIMAKHAKYADKITSVCVLLMDMAGRGQLIREGHGKTVSYKKVGSAKLSNKEEAWRQFREQNPIAPKPNADEL
jgi:hypothetical protein